MNRQMIAALTVCVLTSAVGAETVELKALQELALARNPRIRSMDAEAQMMKARIPQSTALDDPKFKLGAGNLSAKTLGTPRDRSTSRSTGTSQAGTGSGSEDMVPYLELGVSQMLPLGKIAPRRRIAVKEHERAMVRLRAEKVEVLHMLRMNYYLLAYSRSAIRIMEELKKKLRMVIDSETAAAKSGTGSIANVVKANIEYTMLDEEIITLRQQESAVTQKIYYYLGEKQDLRADALSAPVFRDVEPETILREVTASNPELKMFLIDTEISTGAIALRKSEYLPDVDLGFSYMLQKDGARRSMNEAMVDMGGLSFLKKTEKMKRDDMLSFMVTVNVPLWFWSKNRPMVEEMKKKHNAAKSAYQDALNKMHARANTLLGQLVKWRDLHRLYREKLIPQSELALETNLARYRTNAVEFMLVIDSVRMILRYKKEQQMAIAEYYAAYSELSALMGVEVLP